MTTHAAYQGEQQIQLPELVAAAQAGGMRGGTGTYIVGLPSVFSAGCVRIVPQYLVLGRDDEASIAMIAFNEAIDAYSSDGGGASFLSFAEIVIKRRMVDFFRRQARRADEIPPSPVLKMMTTKRA